MNDESNYLKFGVMIGTSTIMMFALMYLHTYSFDHIHFSATRLYMAFIMGAAMATVMLGFMLSMYKSVKTNIAIFIASACIFVLSLWLVRSQTLVDDRSYMKAMIPHHSIAILTSERASFDDARVRQLADNIIKAQRREIKEMKWLLEDIKQNGPATTKGEASLRPVPDLSAAMRVER